MNGSLETRLRPFYCADDDPPRSKSKFHRCLSRKHPSGAGNQPVNTTSCAKLCLQDSSNSLFLSLESSTSSPRMALANSSGEVGQAATRLTRGGDRLRPGQDADLSELKLEKWWVSLFPLLESWSALNVAHVQQEGHHRQNCSTLRSCRSDFSSK